MPGLLLLQVLVGVVLAATGQEDATRPYEFGFVIEGEQHRYEKKDEKGIIMGEYGFITADGVYHVTVYATDEEGNFRILKTNNIRIGLKMLEVGTTTTKPSPPKLAGLSGCSGCLIPSTTPKTGTPKLYPNKEQVTGAQPSLAGTSQGLNPNGPPYGSYNPQTITSGTPTAQSTLRPGTGNLNKINQPKSGQFNPTTNSLGNGAQKGNLPVAKHGITSNLNKFGNNEGSVSYPGSNLPGATYSKIPNLGNGPITNKISLQEEKDKNRDVNSPNSGKKLSEIEKNIVDFMTRLYKFNYTLSFHGHEEEGDVEGRKRGSYFDNGRDGFQRKVEYLANELGYQPRISLIKLDTASTPNEKTEKEQTKLIGNEFIWFYDKSRI